MTYYSKEIEMPKNMKEGLMNFVQMIINESEAGNSREAMLKAVDLLSDLESGVYDGAMGTTKSESKSKLDQELSLQKNRLESEKADAYNKGLIDGKAQKAKEIATALGVAV